MSMLIVSGMESQILTSGGTTSSIGSSPGDPLDCVIIDLELGKEPSDLRVPSTDSILMTALSSESLLPTPIRPRKWYADDDDGFANFDLAHTSDPLSDHCSSIYSMRSSGFAETDYGGPTMSSFRADDVLVPRPLDLSRSTSANPASGPETDIVDGTGAKVDNGLYSTVAVLLGPLPPKPAVKFETSSDDESEALVKEIVHCLGVETSPPSRLTQTSSQAGYFVVNPKAAKLLGLEGTEYVSYPFGITGSR
jgi:hypothetical protein